MWDALQYWKGGIVFYGGVIGGTVAFFVYRRCRPFPLRPYMDVLAPSIAIGTMFGRLGCFLNGCCFGSVSELPWAVSFPKPSPAWLQHHELRMIPPDAVRSLAIHPTQIYSAIDGLVLLLLLSAFFPFRRRDGEVAALLMVTYPITRFLIEFLRDDEGAFFAGLTISQNISRGLALGRPGVLGMAAQAAGRALPRSRRDERVAECALGDSAVVIEHGRTDATQGSAMFVVAPQGTGMWSRIRCRISSGARPSASASKLTRIRWRMMSRARLLTS